MTSGTKGLKVRVDLGAEYSTLRNRFSELSTMDVRRSAARALNRVGVSARKAVAPVIAEALGGALTEPVIRRAIKFRNARGDRLYIDLRAVGGRRLSAGLFKPRQTKAGVTIRLGKRAVRIPGAFLTPAGKVRVRGPDWKSQMYDAINLRKRRLVRGSKPDYPIPQVTVPGVPRVFLDTVVVKAIGATARERFPIEFERDLRARSRGLLKAR